MRTLRRCLRRLMAGATARRDEARLREEIDEHLALQTADNVRAGLSPAEARRQAALKFGAVEAMKECYREQRGLRVRRPRSAGHASCAPAPPPRADVHHRHRPDAGTGHWRDDVDLHAGACGAVGVAPGPRIPRSCTALAGKAAAATWPATVRTKSSRWSPTTSTRISRSHRRLCRTGGVSVGATTVRRPSCGRVGGRARLSGRVRLRQLLRDVWDRARRGTLLHRRG